MTAPTHITFAQLVYLLFLTAAGTSVSVVNALAAGIASLLPDIDTEASMLGTLLRPLSGRIERRFGHRTLTHSALFCLGLTAVLLPLLLAGSELTACLLVGYVTHPILDTATVNGVRLFYPFSPVKCVFPLEVTSPGRYRAESGSKADRVLGVVFLVLCIPAYLIASDGYVRFVRVTQKNVKSAVRDYIEFSKNSTVYGEIRAHNGLTKEDLAGRFEILGALDDHTLLFAGTDGRLHTLGYETETEYIADEVVCDRGEGAEITTRTVDMTGKRLGQIADSLIPFCRHQLFGVLQTREPVSLVPLFRQFAPIVATSTTMRFDHASWEDIVSNRLEGVLVTAGEITVQSLSLKASPGRPLPARHVDTFRRLSEVSLQAQFTDSVRCLRSRGDTVARGELLAAIEGQRALDTRLSLNREKREALQAEWMTQSSRLYEQEAAARLRLRNASADRSHLRRLQEAGFVDGMAVEEAQFKEEQAAAELNRLVSAGQSLRAKHRARIQQAESEFLELQSRLRAEEPAMQLRSPAGGVVVDVRRTVQGERVIITYSINPR